MTTTTSPRTSPPIARRGQTSSSPTPPHSNISKGATARSAVSPRVSSTLNSSAARRTSIKPSHPLNGDTKESLSTSLKHETEQKENLMVQIQDKEQTISTLSAENANLTSALHSAETRLNELYAEQSRSEMEMAQRIDISEKLRAQVRELEKEKRDIQRRYNEQTTTFEAERQAFYDNEQHLKSRIQSLSQARKRPEPRTALVDDAAESEAEADEEASEPASSTRPQTPRQDLNDPDQEPAEMTSLRLELSTLSTSYSSLQSTLVLLQTQLVDLKRVNHELQEENESFMILLREKTLSGQYDVMKQVGAGSTDDEEDEGDDADVGSLRSTGRNTLDRVEEEGPAETLEQQLQLGRNLESQDTDSVSSRNARPRQGRRRGASASHSPGDAPRGESLADLPITGPGLDLAAELGRAENKDILDGDAMEDRDRTFLDGRGKRSRKDSQGKKISSSHNGGTEGSASTSDIDALRTEVKALKDANKALSLYASKIIDRIISQEGFEHVLAVDYDKEPPTPSTATAGPKDATKPRPQSVFMGRSSSKSVSQFSSPVQGATPKINAPNPKAQRRSLSFDWRGFSIFNSSGEKKADPNLRPLTLKPGTSPVTGARKLETQEDEEDRRERERLHATMKLMGIQPSPQSPTVVQKSFSSPGPSQPSPPATSSRRFSFFGSRSTTGENSDASSVHSAPSLNGGGLRPGGSLTHEALEHAEAENSLAALDAHERNLSAEIAKGSSGGFTEIVPRAAGRRSRRSAGGSGHSGSTVWSAGITEDDE